MCNAEQTEFIYQQAAANQAREDEHHHRACADLRDEPNASEDKQAAQYAAAPYPKRFAFGWLAEFRQAFFIKQHYQ
ncbi:hypothetical protein L278_06595 [Mannheimia haemolytica D35]|nr:hypothetical protein L278_06595 [Mannheimia haemolytica D35]